MKNTYIILCLFSLSAFSQDSIHKDYKDPTKKVNLCLSWVDRASFHSTPSRFVSTTVSLLKSWNEIEANERRIIVKDNISFVFNQLNRSDELEKLEGQKERTVFSIFVFKNRSKPFKVSLQDAFANKSIEQLFSVSPMSPPEEYLDYYLGHAKTNLAPDSLSSDVECNYDVAHFYELVDEGIDSSEAIDRCNARIKKVCKF